MALDHPERVDTFNIIDRDDETAKLSALRKYVQEMICSANGQVYEPHLLSNGKAFSELVGLTGPEGPHFSPLKISPAVILGKDSLLLASFLQSTFELDVAREIKCMHILMNLVVYVLHNSRPGANMVLILPR